MTKTVRTEVWVGIYVHRHGRDLSIYPTAGEAEAGRQEIAEEWWDDVSSEPGCPFPDFPTSPADRAKAADFYFRESGEEFDIQGFDFQVQVQDEAA